MSQCVPMCAAVCCTHLHECVCEHIYASIWCIPVSVHALYVQVFTHTTVCIYLYPNVLV